MTIADLRYLLEGLSDDMLVMVTQPSALGDAHMLVSPCENCSGPIVLEEEGIEHRDIFILTAHAAGEDHDNINLN